MLIPLLVHPVILFLCTCMYSYGVVREGDILARWTFDEGIEVWQPMLPVEGLIYFWKVVLNGG